MARYSYWKSDASSQTTRHKLEGDGVITLLGWGVHKIGWSVICFGVLLLSALASVGLGLASIIRGLDGGLVLTVIVLGLLTGWTLARSRLPGAVAGLIGVCLGAGLAILRVGQLGGELVLLLETWAGLVWKTWSWQFSQPRPDERPALQALSRFANGLATLVARSRDWLQTLAAGAPAFDPVAVALMWSFILWLVAVWAAWAVRRRERPFEALVPALALLGAMLGYVGGNPAYLVPVLGAFLLLMVLSNASAREHRWNLKGIDYAEEIRFDLAMVSIPLAFLLLTLAAFVPSVSISQIARYVQRSFSNPGAESNAFSDSLGLIQQPRPESVFDALRSPGLPREHLLGSGPELSKQWVMSIRVEDPSSIQSSHYYWRSTTYDRYTGRGWITNATDEIAYGAGERTIDPVPPNQRLISQVVQVMGDTGGLVYAAGTLISADHEFGVAWRSQRDGDIFGANIGAKNYRVESLLPVAGEAELRADVSSYPAWIRARYLDLPDDLPDRVRVLARDLTALAPTPYDRARAIEAYLRQFPYTLDLSVPPATRDLVDYFLFDLKRGYCDYYASAMVVLARAAGLPARLVVGYATGTFEPIQARYIVTEAEAHSWAEVYFPNHGWIEFEPTGGRASIDRPVEAVRPPEREPRNNPGQTYDVNIQPDANWWFALPVVIALLGLALLLGLSIDGWRLRRLTPEMTLDRIYARLGHYGRWLGLPVRLSDTPGEIAGFWKRKLADLPEQKSSGAPFDQAGEQIGWLTDAYVARSYGPHPPDAEIQKQAIRTWSSLRFRLWYAWVWQFRRNLSPARRVR
jgi:transglutaminase-like putative cysteine protease